jgi:hypothetical protein
MQNQARADESMETAGRKRVRWGTVSVLEYRVGYNASAVPESGGPPVGLVGRPVRHSYSMLPGEEEEGSDSECESVASDADSDAEMPLLLSTGRARRSRQELWVDPMERARILVEDHSFPLEDIALICRSVRATLDSRAFSQLDVVAEKALEASLAAVKSDARPLLRCGGFCGASREKVLLY